MKFLKQHLLVIIMVFIFSSSVESQINPLQIKKVDSNMVSKAKPILILMSTDWCQYCKIQKKQIRKNVAFKNKVDSFYYVEFDAESQDSIVFNGFKYKSNTKRNRKSTHQLALNLSNSDKVIFPAWVLLDSTYKVVFRYNSLLYPEQLTKVLTTIEQLNK